MSQVRVLRYAMELYALKLLPITPARTSRYATNLMPRHGMEPKCSSGWLVWSSTIHINGKKIQAHHPRLSLPNCSFSFSACNTLIQTQLSSLPSNSFRGFFPLLQLLGSLRIDTFPLCSPYHHRFVFQLMPTIIPKTS